MVSNCGSITSSPTKQLSKIVANIYNGWFFSYYFFWQHWTKQYTHVSCFVSLSNVFSLVYNLTMNRLTNEQPLQINEFYYQNASSVKKFHCELPPFYSQFIRPATVIWYKKKFFLPKMQEIDLHYMCFCNKAVSHMPHSKRNNGLTERRVR